MYPTLRGRNEPGGTADKRAQVARFLAPNLTPDAMPPSIAVAVRSAAAGTVKSADAKAANGRSQARHFRPLRTAAAARRRLEA
jgi:hypothetical protein